MKQKVLLLVSMLFAVQSAMWACTNLIVGKKASTDGSVIVSYSADSFGSFGFMCRYPAGKHPKGIVIASISVKHSNFFIFRSRIPCVFRSQLRSRRLCRQSLE